MTLSTVEIKSPSMPEVSSSRLSVGADNLILSQDLPEQAQHTDSAITSPATDSSGTISISRNQYLSNLATIRRKEPL